MSGMIRTNASVATRINTNLKAASNVLNDSESSHNRRGTSLSRTRGFCFIENVSVLTQRASGPMSGAAGLMNTESQRILSIHQEISKLDKQNS